MRTPTHHLFGAVAGLAVLHWHPLTEGPAAAAVFVAAAGVFAGGALSPDVDNQPWWKWADRVTPDEALGGGGPLGHRRFMHWPGIPAAVLAAAAGGALTATPAGRWAVTRLAGILPTWVTDVPAHAPLLSSAAGYVPWAALVAGVAVAWLSHILGDFVFGQGNPRYGLPKGIPLILWWGHVGLGLKADGRVEKTFGWLLVPAAGWLAWQVGGPVFAVAAVPAALAIRGPGWARRLLRARRGARRRRPAYAG